MKIQALPAAMRRSLPTTCCPSSSVTVSPCWSCLLLAHPLGMFLGSRRRVRDPNFVDRIALAVTAPVQRAAVATIDGTAERAGSSTSSLRSVRRENAAAPGRRTRSCAPTSWASPRRARRTSGSAGLVHYDEGNPGPKVIARVLGINPDPNRLTLRIDRGEGDGVRRGQAVVTAGRRGGPGAAQPPAAPRTCWWCPTPTAGSACASSARGRGGHAGGGGRAGAEAREPAAHRGSRGGRPRASPPEPTASTRRGWWWGG